ncbi:MAG: hypothetical protein NTX24_02565 [Candidatus Pacearchaeota archaeon]|nr:hypothetical protein [Candidatus Pacearchaeota archaeon]
MEKDSCLAHFKKQYEPLRKKYKLPSFDDLNKEFEIEKIQERETDFILREIRKGVGEKVGAFLRFFEAVLNPVVAPAFIMAALKNFSNSDKEAIKENYQSLVEIELKSIKLDINYNEKTEAQFITQTFKTWQEIKPSLKVVIDSLSKVNVEGEKKRNSYMG